MSDDVLDRLVVDARQDLRSSLDPAPPDLARAVRRARSRRLAGVAGVVVLALAAVGVVAVGDGDGPEHGRTVVAGPGPSSGTADLLAPGASRFLAPSPLARRSAMASVWTGTELLVWGGAGTEGPLGDGAAYDPRTDTWRMLPAGPLSAREALAAVWTGEELLLWGGDDRLDGGRSDGAAFNPVTGVWRSIAPAPITSAGHPVGVWRGTEMLVLAGVDSAEGAAYDAATDRWRRLPDLPGHLAGPVPSVVWTGRRLVAPLQARDEPWVASLDLDEGTWVEAGPIDRGTVVLAWTGSDVVAVSGRRASVLGADRRSWTTIAEAPEGASPDVFGAWTGTQLLLWDGATASVLDPERRTWEAVPAGGLGIRVEPATVWADGVLLAWSGDPAPAGVMLRPPSTATMSTSTTAPASTTTVPAPPTSGAGVSAQTVVGGTPTAVAGYTSRRPQGTPVRVDVFEWHDGWQVVATFDIGATWTPEPGRPLVVRDVTGDGAPDFVIPLEAASADPYEVLSNDGGAWVQVPFGTDDHIIALNPDSPTADRFVTSTNLCEPSCADGKYRREEWRYSSAERRFTLVRTAICDGIAPGEWRCDPPDSPLATGEPIGHA